MERLTKRNECGGAYYPYCFMEDTCDGVGTSENCDYCDFSTKICEKLAHYEDLEEQGLLLRLPCKVGTMVYNTRWWDETEEKVKVDGKTYSRIVRTQQTVGEWIPVSERLPEEDGWYLETVVCGVVKRTGFGLFVNGIWEHFDNEIETIAWQPLPEPYRKDVE